MERRYCGKIVYGGGDDAFAIVPVADLLDVIKELRALFAGDEFSDPGTVDTVKDANRSEQAAHLSDAPADVRSIRSGEGYVEVGAEVFRLMGARPEGVTASLAALIMPHDHPLSHGVEEVRRVLEEGAKDDAGRDAFAVHLIRGRGAPLEIVSKWRAGDRNVPDAIRQMVDWIRERILSPKIAYDMKAEESALTGWDEGDLRAEYGEACSAELRRLASRHFHGLAPDQKAEHVLRIERSMGELARGLKEQGSHAEPQRLWTLFSDLLVLARFIAEDR